MQNKFFRIKFFTGSHIQIKYLSLLFISMTIPVVLIIFCMYYFIFMFLMEQIGNPVYTEYIIFPVIKKVKMMLIIGIPPLFLVLFIWGMVLSYHFAGPIKRLEKELNEVLADKKYKHRILLRKGDDIKPVSDAINNLLDKLEEKHK